MKTQTKAALLAMFVACSFLGISTEARAAGQRGTVIDNGAYVTLGKTPTSTSGVEFNYGWNNSNQFAAPAVGYFIGIYDVTNSQYVWSSDNLLPQLSAPTPGQFSWSSINVRYADVGSLPPGDYFINFFVRSSYAFPVTNAAEVVLPFTVR
jgi:hypothetical protein